MIDRIRYEVGQGVFCNLLNIPPQVGTVVADRQNDFGDILIKLPKLGTVVAFASEIRPATVAEIEAFHAAQKGGK